MAEPVTDLEGLARKATPGPWRASGVVIWSPENPVDPTDFSGGAVAYTPELDEHGVPDAAYIAAASPDVILALLEERAQTRADLLTELRAAVEGLPRIRLATDGGGCWLTADAAGALLERAAVLALLEPPR